ncbi:unnamed protein product [marine sediment metagenome]|uniref:Right handed beta helix domain-containing protein n=1 Tax=marine sediment metagenome TaxID=412755 RepID=X0S3R9_9ZZZZ
MDSEEASGMVRRNFLNSVLATYTFAAAAVFLVAGGCGGAGGRFGGARTLYVDKDATAGANDGSSWEDAFLTPQAAMNVARPGSEIWVAEGTYTREGSDMVVLEMKEGVSIYGGFAGTESSRDERDAAAHETILDGEDVCYHVVVGASNAVIDGFTITQGNANGGGSDNEGAGMYDDYGVTNLTVANCTFSNNFSWSDGGGMYVGHKSSVTVKNCIFSSNSTHGDGAGMCNRWTSSSTITNCAFVGNSSDGSGGGMWNSESPTVTNCTFVGNSAVDGGGMSSSWYVSPTLKNCIFVNNSATDRGGGMRNKDSSSPNLINCTFSDNSASYGGGISNMECSSPPLTNCILWGNTAPTGPEIHREEARPSTITYSDIQGCGGSGAGWDSSVGTDGGGNIDADPKFVNAAGGDLHLQASSPCIDAGDGTASPTTDVEGNARYDDPATPNSGLGPPWVDMGAYEYQP